MSTIIKKNYLYIYMLTMVTKNLERKVFCIKVLRELLIKEWINRWINKETKKGRTQNKETNHKLES